MTKSELKALEKAFGIPEPEKKNEFIEAFNEKYANTYKYNKQDRKKRILPIIMGYASTAAIAVLVIGTWINLKDTSDIRQKPDVPIVTITTFDRTQTDITTVNDSVTGTTAFSVNESSTKSDKSKSIITSAAMAKTTETKAKNSKNNEVIVTADPDGNTETTVHNDVTAGPRRTTATNRTTTTVHGASTAFRTTTTTRTAATATRRTTTATRTASTASRHMTTATRTQNLPMTTTTQKATGMPQTTRMTYATTGGTWSEWTTTMGVRTTTAATYTQYVPIAVTTSYSDPQDLTVMPDVIYFPGDNMETVETTASGWSWRPTTTPTQADVWYTDNVVEATVVDKIYTIYNYNVYTQYNVKIDKIFRSDGSYKEGDTISVYVEGGVLPSELFKLYYNDNLDIPDGQMVKFLNGNKAELDVDDDYLFILLGDALYVPDGAYAIADKSATSIFKYNGYDYVSLEYYNIYAYPQ